MRAINTSLGFRNPTVSRHNPNPRLKSLTHSLWLISRQNRLCGIRLDVPLTPVKAAVRVCKALKSLQHLIHRTILLSSLLHNGTEQMDPMGVMCTIFLLHPTRPSTLLRDPASIDAKPTQRHGRSPTQIYPLEGPRCRWQHLATPFISFPLPQYSPQPTMARHGMSFAPVQRAILLDSSS